MTATTLDIARYLNIFNINNRPEFPYDLDKAQFEQLSMLSRLFDSNLWKRHSEGQGLQFFFEALIGVNTLEIDRQQELAHALFKQLAADNELVKKALVEEIIPPEEGKVYENTVAFSVLSNLIRLADREITKVMSSYGV